MLRRTIDSTKEIETLDFQKFLKKGSTSLAGRTLNEIN